jgi:anti-sigma factor RsiW
MTGCRRVAGLLLAYASGELSDPDRQDLERHLKGCPLCADEVEVYLLIIRLGRHLDDLPPSSDLAFRLRARLEDHAAE